MAPPDSLLGLQLTALRTWFSALYWEILFWIDCLDISLHFQHFLEPAINQQPQQQPIMLELDEVSTWQEINKNTSSRNLEIWWLSSAWKAP